MYIFHFLRSKDLDKCEAVDEVPKITEKGRLGAPFHLGPLQSLKVKHENSLQNSKKSKTNMVIMRTQRYQQSKNVFFCGQKQDKNLATVTTAALKTQLRVWIKERYRNLQVKKLHRRQQASFEDSLLVVFQSFQNLSTDAR